jgi:DNA-binding transcriptional LysR family regulator
MKSEKSIQTDGNEEAVTMDVTQARTFLAVVSAGSFVNAGARLNVTQSTVSARIKALEEYLGARLFVRNKGGTTLTHAGRQFQRHAALIIRTAEQARQDVGTPEGYRGVLTIGGEAGLWNRLLHKWLPWMQTHAPDVAVRAHLGQPEEMIAQLTEGALDIGVMYTPQSRPGLHVEVMLEDTLVLYATDRSVAGVASPRYVFVDWGRDFQINHRVHFPDFTGGALTVGLGTLGLHHILEHGGAGYFPERLARPFIEAGRLIAVDDAPTFALPVYVVYAPAVDNGLLEPALSGLRVVGQDEAINRTTIGAVPLGA